MALIILFIKHNTCLSLKNYQILYLLHIMNIRYVCIKYTRKIYILKNLTLNRVLFNVIKITFNSTIKLNTFLK